MLTKTRGRLKYLIPIYGNILLIKKIEKLEKRIDSKVTDDLIFQYYEARIERIYDSIMKAIDQQQAIYFLNSACPRKGNLAEIGKGPGSPALVEPG